MCSFLSSVLSQQKFEVTDQHYSPPLGQHYSSRTDQCHSSWIDQGYRSVLQFSFIYKIKENTSSMPEDTTTQKMWRERARERTWPFGFSLYIYIFCLYLGLPYCKLGQPGVLFVQPEVLIPILRSSFVLFSRAFPFLIFQPPPFWTPFSYSNYPTIGFQGGSVAKNCLPMQEAQVRSLGRQDTLEEEMATHSCILAWIIPWTEQPGRLQSMGVSKSWTGLSD